MGKDNREIEAHFLDIDVADVKNRLNALGAQDHGEKEVKEIIFYDQKLTWKAQHRFVRMRQVGSKKILTYKHQRDLNSMNVKEIELPITDWENTKLFLESVDLIAYRNQEKRRHTFTIDEITFDIDTWPSVPTFLEIEANSEEKVKEYAEKLGFQWKDAVFAGAGHIIEHYYHIPVMSYHTFTFEKME